MLEGTLCPPCAAQVELAALKDSSQLRKMPPWGALVRMKGFLDIDQRCPTAGPVSDRVLECERRIRMICCAEIMLRAIMGQQSCRSNIGVPRRDGVPPGSLLVRSSVSCDCCQAAFWNKMSPDSDRDKELNRYRGDDIAEAVYLLTRCGGTELEDWELEGFETPRADLPPCSHR